MYSPLRPNRRAVLSVCVMLFMGILLSVNAFMNLNEGILGAFPIFQLITAGILFFYSLSLPISFYSDGTLLHLRGIPPHLHPIRDFQPQVEIRQSWVHGKVYRFNCHSSDSETFELKCWHWGEKELEEGLRELGFGIKNSTKASTINWRDRD